MIDRYSRQSFLGHHAVEVFRECTVAIVGLGGGGSHIGQQLAHLGFESFQLYDPDKVEWSNLNRLVGASFQDAQKGMLKVEVAARAMLALNPEIEVRKFSCSWQEVAEDIRDADVIFGCLDSYGARQDLETTARRHLIPLIDIGMDIALFGDKPNIFGQVILSLPSAPCMRCLGFLNDENLRREADQYGAAGGRPQVVWANGVLASLAVGVAVDLLTGWNGVPAQGVYLHFDGNTNEVRTSPRLEFAPKGCPHFPPDAVGEPNFS